MNRPTRQHANLLRKIERKAAQSRKTGKKLKRMKRWAEEYVKLTDGYVEPEGKKGKPAGKPKPVAKKAKQGDDD